MRKERDHEPEPLTIKQVTAIARETLLSDGKHFPTIIAEGRARSVVMQMSDFGRKHEEKLFQMFAAGFALASTGEVGELRQTFFISEAWMSTRQTDDIPTLPPSQDPQRREILLITRLKAHEEAAASIVLEMIRDSEGRLYELRSVEELEGQQPQMHSPLLEAFRAGFQAGNTGTQA